MAVLFKYIFIREGEKEGEGQKEIREPENNKFDLGVFLTQGNFYCFYCT